MNRRIAKKILRRGSRHADAWRSWRRDLRDTKRRLGRWAPVNKETRARRLAAFTPGPVRLWWLSFVDPRMPEGSQFLGASQVWADCYMNAVRVAHALGCNPGGEVKGMAADDRLARLVPAEYIGVLMDRHTCEVLEAVMEEKVRDAGLLDANELPAEPVRTTRQG